MIYNDKNNPPFYIGQTVVRVAEDVRGSLKKGDKYEVLNIIWCCSVWGWRIDVGAYLEPPTSCSNCDKAQTDGCHWAAKNFAPIEENTYQDVTKQLAVLPADEVPDIKHVKELQ